VAADACPHEFTLGLTSDIFRSDQDAYDGEGPVHHLVAAVFRVCIRGRAGPECSQGVLRRDSLLSPHDGEFFWD
jgi:hypothetical protein